MMRDGSSDKLDVTKVTKAIGDEWKGLSASEKKVSHGHSFASFINPS
jgi:hypothetical protein